MDAPRSEQMHIDVRTMRYFLALANEGTMRRAANSLHLTQPTLSRQIAALEQAVGAQLYVRKAGRVHLTQEGALLYRYAEQIVGLADRAAADLSDTGMSISGHVTVGCAETTALEMVSTAIARLHEKYPAVVVDLMIGSPLESVQRLEAGLLDFLIDVNSIPRPGFVQLPLSDENNWVVVMRADDPMASLDVVRPEDLAGKQVICSRLVLKSGQLEAWAGDVASTFKVSTTFNLGTYLITVLAAHGLGYALTYEGLQGVVGDPRVVTRPLDPPFPVDRSVLLWKRHRALSPACEAFLEELRQLMQ